MRDLDYGLRRFKKKKREEEKDFVVLRTHTLTLNSTLTNIYSTRSTRFRRNWKNVTQQQNSERDTKFRFLLFVVVVVFIDLLNDLLFLLAALCFGLTSSFTLTFAISKKKLIRKDNIRVRDKMECKEC